MAWGDTAPALVEQPLTVGSPEWVAKRDTLLAAWDNAKEVLERAKESEMIARKAVVAFSFDDKQEGTQRIALNNGYGLKLSQSLSYNIIKSNDEVDKAEDTARTIGNEGQFLFERIITWTPNFSKSEYKKLDTNLETHKRIKVLVDDLIEGKMSSPQLKIEEPKAKL